MAKYELNGHSWFPGDQEYLLGEKGHEYHQGDEVDVDPDHPYIKEMIEAGSLVELGFHESLEQDEVDAQAAAQERETELAAIADEEAHRKVAAEEAKATGVLPSAGDEGESDEGKHASGSERTYIVPNKGATRRRS